jgi:ketosteroid isomerase-like protein
MARGGTAMQEHPNATLLREAADALERGDMQKLDGFIADDIVWHTIGQAEPLRGKEAMRAALGEADFTIAVKVHDVVANDEHAIALGEATATRGGKTLTYRTAEIHHVRDGKITERWAFSDDTAAIVAFLA